MQQNRSFLRGKKDIDLSKINSDAQLKQLCSELRDKIISVVSSNGGHLASNLGVVELTVALYKIFSEENDRVIWDVGHQAYVHKMLTGRLDKIDSIRVKGGISGFTNRQESKYDVFTSGHSSTSISSAFGLACAKNILDKSGHTVAVIGDGALTGGLAYEGLNNAGKFHKNLIVVLNDNDMSISKNVGAISRYLKYIRIRPSYTKVKGKIEKAIGKIPIIGSPIKKAIRKMKYIFKSMLYDTTIFENMGFLYYGPVDGHDIGELMKVFGRVKEINRPVLVHVVTTKGKGYRLSEENPKQFHGMPKFDAHTGQAPAKGCSFSSVFGKKMCELAEREGNLCAITAAMVSGTGLEEFAQRYENRFFDVGIAEQHAVTFSAGLASGGMIPVFAVYSSFLQRSYDQIIHDIAVQNLKIILAVDRAGMTGEDGEMHQGIFDVPFLNSIPNVRILAPSFFDELEYMLEKEALSKTGGAVAIRYPKGGQLYRPPGFKSSDKDFDILEGKGTKTAVVTYGRIFSNVCMARERIKSLTGGKSITIFKLNSIKPINPKAVEYLNEFEAVFFFEESSKRGSVGEVLGAMMLKCGFKGRYFHIAIDDTFVKHASMEQQIREFGLDSENIAKKIIAETEN